MIDLKELRKKCEAATPGPWIVHEYYGEVYAPSVERFIAADGTAQDAETAFIAAVNPQVVLSLLDRIEAYEEALKEISEMTFAGVKSLESKSIFRDWKDVARNALQKVAVDKV